MEYVSCKFAKDTEGFYLTPLIGYSNVKGDRSVWTNSTRAIGVPRIEVRDEAMDIAAN